MCKGARRLGDRPPEGMRRQGPRGIGSDWKPRMGIAGKGDHERGEASGAWVFTSAVSIAVATRSSRLSMASSRAYSQGSHAM